jgi:sialidase-1
MRTAASAAAVGGVLLILVWPGVGAEGKGLVHVNIFTSGTEDYHTFRIPALVTSADGVLIAFAEGRKENSSDPGGGDIDLVTKRSTNQGATWSPLAVVDDPGSGWSSSNPTPLADRDTGRVWIFFNRWEPGHSTQSSLPGTSNNQTWARYSDDQAATWSDAIDLTRVARDYERWGATFLGPGGAIQTRGGRLVVPSAMKPDTFYWWLSAGGFSGRTLLMRAYVLFSDDHGKMWRRGDLVRAQTDENQVVELEDGALMMDARQGSGDHRWLSISADGGQTWSDPAAGQAVPPIAAAIERFTLQKAGDDHNRILWTGLAGPGRKRLVARVSYDEGQTYAVERVIYGGLAAYSDIAILPDRSAGVLWERGISRGYQFITFTRLSHEFLEPRLQQ